ncbi:MAG: TlpA family protein disulfide reductase [Desulfurococcales archaeon]|nr:TlpA family protein disulfide reductase [Desulfurococcales archaeon]
MLTGRSIVEGMKPRIIALLALIIITAGYIVSGGLTNESKQQANDKNPIPTALGAPSEGAKAPSFTVKDIDGNTVSLEEYRGRSVIIWFMAAWCPSCIYMSNIISQATEGREDVVVIMIDMWSEGFLEKAGILGKPGYPPPDTVDRLRDFREKYGRDSWIAVMDDGSLVELYNVRYIDTVFVVDKDGTIVLGGGNVVTVDSLREAIGGG